MSTYKAKPRVDLSNLVPGVKGGTYTIDGEIISLKRAYNRYDTHSPRFTVWVKMGNQRYYGTLPRFLLGCSVGDRVAFKAEVEQSPDDRLVGFYKRPRRA